MVRGISVLLFIMNRLSNARKYTSLAAESARGWMHQMLTYRYSAPFKTMLKTSPLEVHYNESPNALVGQTSGKVGHSLLTT
jgi:hypothetical protein